MGKPIAIAIVGDEKDLVRSLGKSTGELDKFGRKSESVGAKVGKALKRGAAVGAAAVVLLAGAAVKSASDAQQSLGATETVFGKYADTVIDKSDKAASAYGLSANQYRESANLIGSLFKGQGVALDKLAGKSDAMISTASDLAATFGGTTSDAVEALSSAFKGEFDPLERYGISLKQSDINARLAAKGQDKLTGQALKLAKQTASSELIMAQAAQTQGAFARESDTLAGAQQRLSAKVENLKAKVGTLLLPMLTKLANYAGNELLPKLDSFASYLEDNQDQIEKTGRSLGDALLPPLKLLVGLAKDAAQFVGGLPAPVQQLGVQVAVAALIFPKLTGAVTGTTGSLAGFIASARNAETRAATLSKAVRGAAGIGGMVLLAQNAGKADTKIGALGTTAGAALTGFALGGPIGGAIGAGAGAMLSLWKATQKAGTSAGYHREQSIQLKGALDQQTGAVTKLARETVAADLVSSGMAKEARVLGVSTRDVVSAILGNEKALGRVNAAATKYANVGGANATDAQIKQSDASVNLAAYLGVQTKAYEKDRRTVLANAAAAKTWREALKGIPPKVQTVLKNKDYKVTVAEAKALGRQYNLTPKQVRTIIKETGADKARANVKRTREELEKTGRTKADLKPFNTSLITGLNKSESVAQAGASHVGAMLANGMTAGVNARAWAIGDAAAAAVRNALRRANQAAETRSPSRATRRIGVYMSEGLALGIHDAAHRPADEADRAVRGALSKAARAAAHGPQIRARPAFTTTGTPHGGGVVRVELSAEQLHELERGRRLAADLRAYRAAGGAL